MTRMAQKTGALVVAVAVCILTPVAARPGVIKVETYACTGWGAAHEYTMQSLTPKGGRFSRTCPIRLPAGTKVDVLNDDDGYAVVTHRGKTWWVDGERVR